MVTKQTRRSFLGTVAATAVGTTCLPTVASAIVVEPARRLTIALAAVIYGNTRESDRRWYRVETRGILPHDGTPAKPDRWLFETSVADDVEAFIRLPAQRRMNADEYVMWRHWALWLVQHDGRFQCTVCADSRLSRAFTFYVRPVFGENDMLLCRSKPRRHSV